MSIEVFNDNITGKPCQRQIDPEELVKAPAVVESSGTEPDIEILKGGQYIRFTDPVEYLHIDNVDVGGQTSYLEFTVAEIGGFIDLPPLSEAGGGTVFDPGKTYRLTFLPGNVVSAAEIVAPTPPGPGEGVWFSSGGTLTSAWRMANVICSEGGMTMHVRNGGAIYRVSAISNQVIGISSGGTANKITTSNGSVRIFPGGILNDAILNVGGVYISSGGTANNVTASTGYIYISSGGTANNAVLHALGTVVISSGGTANKITTSNGNISAAGLGALVIDAQLTGGKLNILSPTTDYDPISFSIIAGSETNIRSGALRYNNAQFAGQCVSGAFTGLSGTYRLGIGDGISALDPIVGNSDTDKARIYAFSGAYVSGAQIGISGDINVYPGAVAVDTVLGGYAGERFQCELTVWGGTASGVVVSSNAYLNVFSGGSVAGTAVVHSGGSMRVRVSGTSVADIDLKPGATFSAYENAAIGALNVSSGGTAHVSGGAAAGTLAVSGGTVWLRSASASAVTLSPGCGTTSRPTVSASGANIGTLTLASNGAATLYSGTTVTSLQQQGGYVIARGARISGGRIEGSDFHVSSGATATSITAIVGGNVAPKKKIVVFSGGVVSGLDVEDISKEEVGVINVLSNYGVVSVMSGGRLENTEFTNIVVSGGGVVDGVTPKKVFAGQGAGGDPGFVGSLVVQSGGTALNVVSSAGWTIVVEEGGSITYKE